MKKSRTGSPIEKIAKRFQKRLLFNQLFNLAPTFDISPRLFETKHEDKQIKRQTIRTVCDHL